MKNIWEENSSKPTRSRKPCIFCGEVSYHTNQVCRDCYAIYKGKKAKAVAEATLGAPATPVMVDVDLSYHIQRRFAGEEIEGFEERRDLTKSIVAALLELAGFIETSDPNRKWVYPLFGGEYAKVGLNNTRKVESSHRGYGEYYTANVGNVDLLNKILQLIANLSLLNYQEGEEQGANLLGRIISGELTVDETNEKLR